MIHTERLILRPWRDEDLDAIAAVNADPGVMCWIGDGAPYDRETSALHLSIWRDYWAETGHGLFALEEIATEEVIGFTGLMAPRYLPGYEDRIEIGWRLRRDRWGAGYASEAARASLAHGFETLGLAEITSVIRHGNDASINVATKIGMRLQETIPHPAHTWPLLIYSIER